MNALEKYEPLIVRSAEAFRLDANLIRAIIMTESSGDTNALRFEPHWHLYNRPSDWAGHLGISVQEEETNQATSWGLMQVMGAVARDLGFTDDLTMLLTPDIGVFYGCKKLKQLSHRYGGDHEEDVVSAYNQGDNRMSSGQYTNYRYVDRVYGYLRDLRQIVT